MRTWTRKSASIQPRTSLRKSAVSWPASRCHSVGDSGCGGTEAGSPKLRSISLSCPRVEEDPTRGSILLKFCHNSVKIAPNFSKFFIIFCIQYSIFQHFSKSTRFCEILPKFLQNFVNFLRNSEKSANICKICQQK